MKDPNHIESKERRNLFKLILAGSASAASTLIPGEIKAFGNLPEPTEYSIIEKILNKEPVGSPGGSSVNKGPLRLTYNEYADENKDKKYETEITQVFFDLRFEKDKDKIIKQPIDEIDVDMDRDFNGEHDLYLNFTKDSIDLRLRNEKDWIDRTFKLEKKDKNYTAEVWELNSQISVVYTLDDKFELISAEVYSDDYTVIDFKNDTVRQRKNVKTPYKGERKALTKTAIRREMVKEVNKEQEGYKGNDILNPDNTLSIKESVYSLADLLPRIFESRLYKIGLLKAIDIAKDTGKEGIDIPKVAKSTYAMTYGLGEKTSYIMKRLFAKPSMRM